MLNWCPEGEEDTSDTTKTLGLDGSVLGCPVALRLDSRWKPVGNLAGVRRAGAVSL